MCKEWLEFVLNGEPIAVEVDAGRMLVDVLRDDLGMKSVKKACDEGECGACTVVMDGLSVASCIMPAGHAQGTQITTVEGLSKDGELHPLQEAFLEEGAVQCGFCTPGMLMAAKALLGANTQPTREEIRKAISGNICRCTGYKKIISATAKAADKISRLEKKS
jgi:carbon-monoxide dehydrogenase small subunit